MNADRASRSGWFREKNPPVLAMRRIRGRMCATAIASAFSAAFALAPGCGSATAQESAATPAGASAQSSPAKASTPTAHSRKRDHEYDQTRETATAAAARSSRSHHARAANKADTATKANGSENASPFGSFGGANRGPVNIQSDSLSLDYKQTTTTFTGHVHATQADGVLIADKLIVKHGKDFNDVQKMIALGDVRISQGLRWCTSDQAVLDQAVHTVVLTGSPVCHDANDQIAGAKITVHLDSGKSEVEGVKALIFPRQSKTSDNEASADHVK